MIRRFDQKGDEDSDPGRLSRWFAASLVFHACAIGLILLLLWNSSSRVLANGSKITFIPRGHAQGAENDPTAAPIAAPPNPVAEPVAPAPKPPDPPKIEEKVKPPDPPPVKKEDKPKPKPKDPEPPKIKPQAPPKPKEDKKPKETPKDKTDKTADKKNSKDKPKEQKLAMAQLAPSDEEPNPKAKGAPRPQQGKADGEEKVGIETHEGPEGPLSGWNNQVQRKVESKWLTPEGILIVPDRNSARIKFTVNRKGELVGQPEIVEEASDPSVGQTGLKAVLDAAPLPPLPDDYKENQHEVIITFRLVK
jgi:outer membrane biosynthesis protein TonB